MVSHKSCYLTSSEELQLSSLSCIRHIYRANEWLTAASVINSYYHKLEVRQVILIAQSDDEELFFSSREQGKSWHRGLWAANWLFRMSWLFFLFYFVVTKSLHHTYCNLFSVGDPFRVLENTVPPGRCVHLQHAGIPKRIQGLRFTAGWLHRVIHHTSLPLEEALAL